MKTAQVNHVATRAIKTHAVALKMSSKHLLMRPRVTLKMGEKKQETRAQTRMPQTSPPAILKMGPQRTMMKKNVIASRIQETKRLTKSLVWRQWGE
jgi:hypothetical protein